MAHPVPPGRRSGLLTRRKILTALVLLVIAAAAGVTYLLTRETPLARLVTLVGKKRPIAARVTGGFAYASLQTPVREPIAPGSIDPELREEVERLRKRAVGGSAADIHAWGVAQLLTGDTRGAVTTLDTLRQAYPGAPVFEADFGAASLTLFLEGKRAADATAALEAIDRAIALAPALREPRFNKALALETSDRLFEAIEAWEKYMQMDGRSRWGDEARRRRDVLRALPAR